MYGTPVPDVQLRIEQEALGTRAGVRGFTTLAQADALVAALALSASSLLLDVGAGRGWPGLYIAQAVGCPVILTDIPRAALASARSRAAALQIDARAAQASATHLPFAPDTFDGVVNTDVL